MNFICMLRKEANTHYGCAPVFFKDGTIGVEISSDEDVNIYDIMHDRDAKGNLLFEIVKKFEEVYSAKYGRYPFMEKEFMDANEKYYIYCLNPETKFWFRHEYRSINEGRIYMNAEEARNSLEFLINSQREGYDSATVHEDADDILCQLLSYLGYDDVVNAYQMLDKNYG